MIARCCYDGINVVFHAPMVATAPERPVRKTASVTRHEPTQADQFYGSDLATVRDAETAKLVISRAKTNWTGTELVPVEI